ncbi:7472_t:CDS:2, partial [Dentiscutata erythropus]
MKGRFLPKNMYTPETWYRRSVMRFANFFRKWYDLSFSPIAYDYPSNTNVEIPLYVTPSTSMQN